MTSAPSSTHLAVHVKIAASTQNGALNALVFLYLQVLKQPFPDLEGMERAKRPKRIPTVFTADEMQALLAQLSGTPRLMAGLLYRAGLRLMECVHLRVKDVDFAYQQITVRDGKGGQDRVSVFQAQYGGKLDMHLGFFRWAFGHAGVNPGGNLINFRSRQERAVQRHLAKRADAPR